MFVLEFVFVPLPMSPVHCNDFAVTSRYVGATIVNINVLLRIDSLIIQYLCGYKDNTNKSNCGNDAKKRINYEQNRPQTGECIRAVCPDM